MRDKAIKFKIWIVEVFRFEGEREILAKNPTQKPSWTNNPGLYQS
jgi:hypothetical protein